MGSRDAASPPSLERIETPHLIGRPPTESDFDLLHQMHTDPNIMKTLGGLQDEAFTRRVLVRFIDHWRQHGFGVWMFEDKAGRGFVGRGGLQKVRVEGQSETEILYALTPNFWGRGLGTQIARASAAVAFEHLALEDVAAFTMTTNNPSAAIMRRIGMTYERDFVRADLPHVFYRMKRDAWLSD
ncbi:MAG: GNAT family N-acetyltransferase [Alphaproteobacteria bacterium]